MNNTAENDFLWISQGKVATVYRYGGQMYQLSMSNFLRILHVKNHYNWLIFDRVIVKIKRGPFFVDTV